MEKIILTGASDGIGKALAFEFANRGHVLGLIARRENLLNEVKLECEKRGSPKVLVRTLDITDEAKLESVLDELDDAFSGATMFIANAGITSRSSFQSDAWEEVKKTFMVNVMGTIHGLEHMKLKMIKRRSGILCGISSIAAARGMPTAGSYSSSKAALTTHLETMRVDLIPFGVSVVTVAPGFIETEMTKKNKGNMPFLMKADRAAKIFVDGILKRKRFVVAPRPYRFIYPILQMLPRALFDRIMRIMYKRIRG